ncbi:RNA-directed DNA polymerase [Budvicia aquatica]|uniref:Reverse transcriptase domain-containing protein n=1 Tax=Budvicia aquatica TaxID=82979 RepID=A0A2C6DP08_9GAMM|nr:RNA-directed DNA polymerase [Budvicia aquatica]PHI30175.1 hypothetical protein CRN84_12910 [Budvicia aquatica]
MSELFSHTLLESAFTWLCQTRKHFPANAGVWHLRFHWRVEKQRLYQQLNAGTYQLSPLQLVKTAQGDTRAIWSSPDALVLKCLTLLLTALLPVHPRCEHIKGHQGGKKSVQRLHQVLRQPNHRFVCRTDIKGYYARINKQTLYSQVQSHVQNPILLNLVWQFLHYSVEDGGTFHAPEFGIARSSSLSPLLAAFHLYEVDAHFANQPNLDYSRYMDDFFIIAKTRWQLRRAVRKLNQFFNQYGFRQHPDKTFIGPTRKGTDWMGYWLTDQGVQSVAPRALANHLTKLRRLYEQTRHLPARQQQARVAGYIGRWYLVFFPEFPRILGASFRVVSPWRPGKAF